MNQRAYSRRSISSAVSKSERLQPCFEHCTQIAFLVCRKLKVRTMLWLRDHVAVEKLQFLEALVWIRRCMSATQALVPRRIWVFTIDAMISTLLFRATGLQHARKPLTFQCIS